jgi:hypothetical protein
MALLAVDMGAYSYKRFDLGRTQFSSFWRYILGNTSFINARIFYVYLASELVGATDGIILFSGV